MKAKNTEKREKINKIRKFLTLTLITSGIFSMLAVTFKVVWAKELTVESVIYFVNEERKLRDLEVLAENDRLFKAAQEKSEDMINSGYFAHTSPGGITPWHWIDENEYDYIYAGENLAINFSDAESQHKAWMDSPDHRKNIINPNYKEIGVAIREGNINGKPAVITVQMFGARNEKAAVLAQYSEGEAVEKSIKGNPSKIAYSYNGFEMDNYKFQKKIERIKDDEEKSKEMVLIMGELNSRKNIFNQAFWILLPLVLILSVLLNIITLISSSRYHYNYSK